MCNVASALPSLKTNLIHIDLVSILYRISYIRRLLIEKPPIFYYREHANIHTHTHTHACTRIRTFTLLLELFDDFIFCMLTFCGHTLTHDSNKIYLSICMTFEFEIEIVVRFEVCACVSVSYKNYVEKHS